MSLCIGSYTRVLPPQPGRTSLIQTCTPNGHLYGVTYTRCRIDTINSPDDGHMAAPKHVENRNKRTWKIVVRQFGYLQRFSKSPISIFAFNFIYLRMSPYVPTDCMFQQTVCSNRLYVPTDCMFQQTVCSNRLYAPTDCMFQQTVCSNRLYVPTDCMFQQTVCSNRLSVGSTAQKKS